MGYNFRLSLKNLGKSVIGRNLPYPFLRGQSLNIFYGDSILKQQRHFKYLGVVVDESLSWNNYVSHVASRVYPKLKLLSTISSFLSPEILLKIYKMTNLPKYLRLWLHRMGFLQQEELRFSGKVAKQSNANNFKNKSLSVHTVNDEETWPVNII